METSIFYHSNFSLSTSLFKPYGFPENLFHIIRDSIGGVDRGDHQFIHTHVVKVISGVAD